MMVPRRPSRRVSRLEYLVRRFQERWETNPRYRAMVIGGVGLVLILTMCASAGAIALASNGALGQGGNNQINSNTGTNKVTGASSFPTPTFSSANVATNGGPTPGGTSLQNSTTPVPSATASSTVTPTTTTGGGGGGTNTAQFVCSGGSNGVTWTFSPCPLMVGQSGTMTIRAPAYPSTGTNIIVSLGGCPKGDCTIDDPPSAFATDATGTEVISFTVAADVPVGGPPVSGEIGFPSGLTIGINTVGSCQ